MLIGLILGLFLLFIGIVGFYNIHKKTIKIKKVAIIVSTTLSIWGISLCISSFFGNVMFMLVLSLGMGLFSIVVGSFNIAKVFLCNKKLQAVFKGENIYISKNSYKRYSPIFRYQVNNQYFENQSGETYKLKQLERKYVYGKTYDIYIMPRQPEIFITIKRVRFGDVMMMIMGVLFLYVCVTEIFPLI